MEVTAMQWRPEENTRASKVLKRTDKNWNPKKIHKKNNHENNFIFRFVFIVIICAIK